MLIRPENSVALAALLFVVVSVCLWVEQRPWGRHVPAAIMVMGLPLALTSAGVIPGRAPAYDFVSEHFVAIAIPLLLFKVNLKRILRDTGRTLGAYLVGAVGTFVGVVVAFAMVRVGRDAPEVAAVYAAGYIGGGINFVAVAKSVQLDDPVRLAAVLGARTTVALLYLLLLSLLPRMRWFRTSTLAALRPDPPDRAAHIVPNDGGSRSVNIDRSSEAPDLQDLATALAASLVIYALSNGLAIVTGTRGLVMLYISILALAAANLLPGLTGRLRGEFMVGMLLVYVFFAALGAGADFVSMLRDAPALLTFGVVTCLVHLVFAFGVGRLLGFSDPEITIGSNAGILGPPTAAAQAADQGWTALVAPGIVCGLFGYAIGTFAGIAVYELLVHAA